MSNEIKELSKETELKILKYAVVIISEHGVIAGNRTCQDWSIDPSEIAPPDKAFTTEEKQSIAFNFEQFNSDGEDYDEDCLFFHDEMSVSFMLSHALEQIIIKLEKEQ